MLAVVAAFRNEIIGYLKSGGFRKVSESGGVRLYTSKSLPHVVVSNGGPGRARTVDCMSEVLARFDPHLVVSAGFAAGTRADQLTGSAVICDRLLSVEGPAYLWQRQSIREIDINPILAQNMRAEIQNDERIVHMGSCLTVPQLVHNSSMKAWVGSTFGVSVIDMDGYWAALAADEANVPFLPLRIVLETVDENVSASVSQSLEDGPIRRIARGARFVASRPHEVSGLVRMGRKTARAGNSMVSYLTLLAQTPMALRMR